MGHIKLLTGLFILLASTFGRKAFVPNTDPTPIGGNVPGVTDFARTCMFIVNELVILTTKRFFQRRRKTIYVWVCGCTLGPKL
jgi:hypothetical protein